MKTIIAIIALAVAMGLSGCASIAARNAKTAADVRAGRAAAEEGRRAAQAALEAVKNIQPSR